MWGAGTDAINLTGNGFGQSIYGNAGPNVRDGGGGIDYLVGGPGNDRYFVDNARDVIIELAGRKIENIYDYTFAIDALKIGEPVKVVVDRNGKKVELKVTPRSRQ